MSESRSLYQQVRDPQSSIALLVSRVIRLVMAAILTIFLLAIGMYFFERDASGGDIRTYGDALFWTASQMTTVSSSLSNPLTTGGRLLAVSIDFISVAVVSLLFGSIAQHINITSPERKRSFRGGNR